MVDIFTVRRFCVVQKQKGVADAMIEASEPYHGLALQRHLSALPKFTPAKLRVCGCQRPGIVVFYAFVNLCVTKHVHISVAVGLRRWPQQ